MNPHESPEATHNVQPRQRFERTRLELGTHIDPAELEAGKYTPDGKRVLKERRQEQAAINREWLANERARLQAARGQPEAYATLGGEDETAPLDETE